MPARKWIAAHVEKVRAARRQQGHELRPLQQGIVEAVAEWDPAHEAASREQLDAIRSAIRDSGRWTEQEEWRISTWFNSSIACSVRDGGEIYQVSVDCDGQTLSCACPTLEGAYAFMRLYQAIIVDQFYSIGPPWADTGIFKS